MNTTTTMTTATEIEVDVKTRHGTRVSIHEWDDGGAWLHLQAHSASMSCVLTRAEAQQVLEGLQALLAREVV